MRTACGVTGEARAVAASLLAGGGRGPGDSSPGSAGRGQAPPAEPPRRSSTARAGAPGRRAAPVPIWDRRPVRILVHHTATPEPADVSRAAAAAGWPGPSRPSTWTSAAGSTPASTSRSAAAGSSWRAATAAWSCCAAASRQVEGAHCTGQNVVAIGIENEGTYSDDRPAAGAVERGCAQTCAYICPRYGINADRDLRPPRLQEHRLPRRPALRRCCRGCAPRSPGCSAAGSMARRRRRAAWPLLRTGDARPGRARGPVPAARRGRHRRSRRPGRFDAATAGPSGRSRPAPARRRSTACSAASPGRCSPARWPRGGLLRGTGRFRATRQAVETLAAAGRSRRAGPRRAGGLAAPAGDRRGAGPPVH